jgi:hypothetical protein
MLLTTAVVALLASGPASQAEPPPAVTFEVSSVQPCVTPSLKAAMIVGRFSVTNRSSRSKIIRRGLDIRVQMRGTGAHRDDPRFELDTYPEFFADTSPPSWASVPETEPPAISYPMMPQTPTPAPGFRVLSPGTPWVTERSVPLSLPPVSYEDDPPDEASVEVRLSFFGWEWGPEITQALAWRWRAFGEPMVRSLVTQWFEIPLPGPDSEFVSCRSLDFIVDEDAW